MIYILKSTAKVLKSYVESNYLLVKNSESSKIAFIYTNLFVILQRFYNNQVYEKRPRHYKISERIKSMYIDGYVISVCGEIKDDDFEFTELNESFNDKLHKKHHFSQPLNHIFLLDCVRWPTFFWMSKCHSALGPEEAVPLTPGFFISVDNQ